MSRKIKILLFGLILGLGPVLSSCVSDPESFYFYYEELKEKVIAIELINYDNSDVKIVKKKDDILSFDFDKMEVLQVLEVEKTESLLLDLSKIHFHVSDNLTKYSDSTSDMSIKITYTNDDFLIISLNSKSNFIVKFNKDGSVGNLVLRFTDNKDFADLMKKFFAVELNNQIQKSD